MRDEASEFIHIYANGRRFVIVPVMRDSTGEAVEIEPAAEVPLTLGRPTVVRLAWAVRDTRAVSRQARTSAARWDGEAGRWWDHHLLSVSVAWEEDQVVIRALQAPAGDPIFLSPDVSDDELSETLITLLGEKLHAT